MVALLDEGMGGLGFEAWLGCVMRGFRHRRTDHNNNITAMKR